MDAYNANPNSMDAAISNLASLSDHKKVAILGDMFELGEDSMLEHQKIVDQIKCLVLMRYILLVKHFIKPKACKK